jgi:DNA-directed RNA polymerase subunit alpha
MLIIQRPEVEAGEARGNTQSFVISPLEPGFGHTLGNSLRRTLLSSIPGAAVTQVRFDEALHEFDTIAGVKEDVTDLILNLKDLVLRCVSDEPVTLRLDARGPGDVHAGDIQTTSDVEILNPELHIATINAKGRLAVDLTVEQGRGYLSAERNKRTAQIGVIPVDAIFSPVRRVAFSVEPTRVEQATNYDKLTVEIETDGSISPREALASAGDTLRSLVGLVAELSRSRRSRRRRPISTCRSKTSTCRSGRATASSGRASTRSANSSRRPKTTCSRSPTSARRASKRCSRSSTSAGCRCG